MVVGVFLLGIFAFWALARSLGRALSQGSSPAADSMYGNYADSLRKQRRYARQHGGEGQHDEGAQPGGTVVAFPKARGRCPR
jgi:hypothetical protein